MESFLEQFRKTKMDFDIAKGVESLSDHASILKDLRRKMISFDLKFEGGVEKNSAPVIPNGGASVGRRGRKLRKFIRIV